MRGIGKKEWGGILGGRGGGTAVLCVPVEAFKMKSSEVAFSICYVRQLS